MKKFWIKIFFAAVIILACGFTALHLFLVFQGRNLIIRQLQNLTQKKVTLGDFAISAPLDIRIKNLNIEGTAKVDSILISPSLASLLFGRLALNRLEIIKPELTYERFPAEAAAASQKAEEHIAPDTPASLPQTSPSLKPPQPPQVKPGNNRHLPLVLKQVEIKDGKINFIDHTVGPAGITITLKDINFDLSDLYLIPRSAIANFQLKGKIPWKEGREEGSIEAEGWINPFKRDMQAKVQVRDIDGVYLYPYYSAWVDLEKARIESAKLNFTSDLQGLHNNLTADCHLELTDIVRKPRPPEEEAEKAEKITDVVLDIFRTMNQGKIVLDFTIRTKMDRPEFGFGNIKMAFEDKLAQGRKGGGIKTQDVLSLPANLVQGTIKGATDLTTAVIGGTISAGKEIVKAVGDSFKKEKKE